MPNPLVVRRVVTAGRAVPGFSAEAQQFFDRLMTPPSGARQAAYANLIDSLVAGGVWAKLDALYVWAAADEATALTNLRQSAYAATKVGAPTFDDDGGYTTTNGDTLNSNFNPSTASGPQYTQNDALFATWSLTAAQANSSLVNLSASGVNIILQPKWSDNQIYWRINTSTFDNNHANAGDSAGLWLVQRTGSNAQEVFKNNSSMGTGTRPSAAHLNESIIFKGTYKHFASVIGASLTLAQRTALYDALTTYKTAVGA